MTCRELSGFIDDYLAGELPAERRRVFEQHVANCPDCTHYLDSYRHTIELGRAAFDDEDQMVPLEVPPALVQAILEARRRQT